MENKTKNITLLIDYQRYPLKIKEEEEQLYHDTEKLINSLINKYRSWLPDLEDVHHLRMALIELGYENLKLKERVKE